MSTRAIDTQITYWAKLCSDYPLNQEYKNTLSNLQQERADIANKIGRKVDNKAKRELGFPFNKGSGR